MDYCYVENIALKREKLLKSSTAKKMIYSIIKAADEAMEKPCYALKMSDYMLYFKTGNRRIFETEYFERRSRGTSLMFAYWLTEDEKYLNPLINHIFYICDEFTWCLPAHCDIHKMSTENIVEFIDLFQAETARFFAETVMCVGDKLPGYVLDRMNYEIRRRIFSSIIKGVSYWWENCKMNWATVCGAGCVMALLYFGDESEKKEYVPRFTNCLDTYLEGIEDDGCCQEGIGYWGYGFGHFVILAQALKKYSRGEVDYFKNSKVKNLAMYPQRVRLSDSNTVMFSDAREGFSFEMGLVCFLKSIYNEVALPDLKYGTWHGNIDSVSELLWFDEDYSADELTQETHYFENTAWYISRRDGYGFAAKGGNNDEPHNHNDIGSFIITVDDTVLIADPGRGEYRKETFLPDIRYTFIQNSSFGHSVPIINGEQQMSGAEFCAKNVRASENSFELDIENAYKKGLSEKIHRRFDMGNGRIILADRFEKTEKVTERIISKKRPEIRAGELDFGNAKILFNPEKCSVSIEKDGFLAPNCVDTITIYKIDFALKESEKIFKLDFIIKGEIENGL